MNEVYELTGADLRSLFQVLGIPDSAGLDIGTHQVRVAIDGGFKISVNGGVWTPPLGVKA